MFRAKSLPFGAILLSPITWEDPRGFFRQTYQQDLYAKHGITCSFPQDNLSFSKKNTLRGLHFQRTPGQAKLVSVCSGKIFDVFVDIRKESPSFGKWEGVYLDGSTGEQLYLPPWIAHGFCVLSQSAHVTYKVSAPYSATEERSIRFDDPTIGIVWPVSTPILSERDQNSPFLREAL